MIYELAKKLEDAGFPQGFKGAFDDSQGEYFCGESEELAKSVWISLEEYEEGTVCDGEWKLYSKNPTLSELIEACGDEFDSLKRLPASNSWVALRMHDGENDQVPCFGATPEEAVANLYLAINKK